MSVWSKLGQIPKIIILVVAILLAIAVLLGIFSGPIAKYYIENHDKELIGRKVRIEKLVINPVFGTVKARNLNIYEKDDNAHFLAFRNLKVKMSVVKLISKNFNINRIEFDSLDVNILQNEKKFNFDDILAKFKSDSTKKDAAAKPWILDINNITILKSHINYKDLQVGSKWGFNKINIKIPRVYFAGKNTDAGINLNFAEGGSLSAKLAYNMESSMYDLSLIIRKFTLEGVLPYVQQSANADKMSGLLSINMHVKGSQEHIMEADIKGRASVNNFSLSSDKEGLIIALDSASTNIEDLDLKKNVGNFDYIRLYNPRTQYVMHKDSTNNFTYLMKKSSKASSSKSSSSSKSMRISIKQMRIYDGNVIYKDEALPGGFDYALSEINVMADNLNPDASNRIKGSAVLGKAGKVNFDWAGNFENMRNMDLRLTLKNIDFTDFTPYSKHFVGNKLEGGVLQFISRNVIKDNKLVGDNKLEIFKPKVSKRVNNHPVYNLPVRLGVYVLTDRKGLMSIDLPVTGDLDNPKFSYRKIIFKTIGNVLVKVAVAPFSAIGSLFGAGKENIDHVEFDAGLSDFNTKEYTTFKQIVEIAGHKPEMNVKFDQEVNMSEVKKEFTVFMLKRDFYNSRHSAHKDTLTPQTLFATDRFSDIDIESKQVGQFADSLMLTRGLIPSLQEGNMYGAEEKAIKLYGSNCEQKILEFAQKRNENLGNYMTRMNIGSGRYSITTVPADSMRVYKGKHMYKVSVSMQGGD
ncbi:MAG TPA: DUF748 domain-containing protein [Candidatus Egerieousia sp.]|nr:DUF748 domain-containing protein [Candidatus Egerieousia sp.]HPT05950.1 DUF748 domain-containing protein [Candidatus Egerieousia sp.]